MKILFLGAGSVVFTRNLFSDLLAVESIRRQPLELALNDIDPERLETARQLAKNLGQCFGAEKLTVTASTDRRRLMEGADFVICTVNVGGFDATRKDFAIPEKFGLNQTIGDTLGAGGIFRAARTAPVLLAICRDIRRYCPKALLMNYVNPMGINCLFLQRAAPGVKLIGLCHGVQASFTWLKCVLKLMDAGRGWLTRHLRLRDRKKQAAEWLEMIKRLASLNYDFHCAGINHMAFFLRLQKDGKDQYPKLWHIKDHPELFAHDRVRFELMLRLGYYMTESPHHTAEYVPFFLQHPGEIKRMGIQTGRYLKTCREQQREFRLIQKELRSGIPMARADDYHPSHEYPAKIIQAMLSNQTFLFNGNVSNGRDHHRLISNLPNDCCVETPCAVDRRGIRPARVGNLPAQCAAIIQTNLNAQELAARALLEENPFRLRQAMMLDPHTASTLTLGQIDQLCGALLRAHRPWLAPGLRKKLPDGTRQSIAGHPPTLNHESIPIPQRPSA
ncbi:MAG: alpha-galactosidase [Verrucomicrobiae bacterium]|nr:alpha-galactosidase [Verrucomicrobiae bacterium]